MQRHTLRRNHTSAAFVKKTFLRNSDLIRHAKTHTEKKSYQCNICEKTFLRNSNLIRHTKKHTGKKSYQCIICEKVFLHDFALKIHEKLHTEEKSYQCCSCNRVFSNGNNTLNQVLTYTGENPYQCSDCNKASSNNTDMIHIGERPYINNDFDKKKSGSHCDKKLKTKTNIYQITINNLLLCLDLPLKCGRVVNTSGSCFYDTVLALLEDPEIKQNISSHAKHITNIQDLRLALANFMETNTTLQSLEHFLLQRDDTLADKKLT